MQEALEAGEESAWGGKVGTEKGGDWVRGQEGETEGNDGGIGIGWRTAILWAKTVAG